MTISTISSHWNNSPQACPALLWIFQDYQTHRSGGPPTTLDNQPVISSLAILSSRQEGPDEDMYLQVLVQWKGLHVDDTSWEDWATLKGTYHLKDKVIFDEVGNDRPSGSQAVHTERPKRRITTPRRFQDFV